MENKFDVLHHLSPGMKKVLEVQNSFSDDVFSTANISFDDLRKNYNQERVYWNEGGYKPIKILDDCIETAYGCSVKIRLYYPNETQINPCIFYIHGGGFVLGNLDTHDRIMRLLCEASQAVVIGIDYSLSPEAKFPQALTECSEVILQTRKKADHYQIDKDKIGIAGDSGGANLSIASALYLRDHFQEDIQFIKSLLLYYGSFGLKDSISMRRFGGPWDGLEKQDLEYYNQLYIASEKDLESPYFNIFNADLKTKMPSTYICSAEFDPLVDDSSLLHHILNQNGITNTHTMYKGLLHAFLHHSRLLNDSKQAIEEGATFFKNHL